MKPNLKTFDLKPFTKEMEKEYLRHYPEKKDSWKKDFYKTYRWRYSSMPPAIMEHPQIDYLIRLLERIFNKWKKSGNIDELVDMANVGAMIWIKITNISNEILGETNK